MHVFYVLHSILLLPIIIITLCQDQSKEWQANSSHTLELQMNKITSCETAISESHHTIQELRERITQQEQLCKQLTNASQNSYLLPFHIVTLAVVAVGAFALGRLT